MALTALVTDEGIAKANALNGSGFLISIPTFSVASIAGALAPTRNYGNRNATFFTAAVTGAVAGNAATMVYTCTIPAGATLGVTSIAEIYMEDALSSTLYVIAQPDSTLGGTITYDPAGSTTFEISVTMSSVPSSAYNIVDIGSINLATHEANAAFHPKSNFGATTSPLVTSDAAAGYNEGSVWVNTLTNQAYVLVDKANGAAVWKEISPATTGLLNNYTAVIAPTVAADSGAGYGVGSVWVDTVTNRAYTATDVAAGAAVWTKTGSSTSVATTFPVAPVSGQLFHNTTNDITYIWDGNAWIDIAAAGGGNVKNNYTATTDPVTTSDTTAGYNVGSLWVNTLSGTTYIATNTTAGAAVWSRFGGAQEWSTVTTLHTAIGNDAVFVDTTALPSTVTLPAAPVLGMKVTIVDHKGTFATNSCTIARNGKTIMGIAAAMTLATNNRFVTLAYDGVSDWRITA